MINTILSLVAVLFYGIAVTWQSFYFARKVTLQRSKGWSAISADRQAVQIHTHKITELWFFGFAAILLHTILLYYTIDVGIGQNLSFFNLLSLVAWLVALLVLIATINKPIVANLTFFAFPFAAASIVLTLLFPRFAIVNTAAKPNELVHIILSTVAFSLLCIAALQAILLAILERQLRHSPNAKALQILPPLEIMESLLFKMIAIGFIFLTAVLVTSFWSFYPVLFTQFRQKTLLALVAWLVFATLLLGRKFFGWRGQQAVRWTLSGVFFVMLTYFSSEFL